MHALAMLVAMRVMPVALMQPMRLMQNLLVILLTAALARMNPTMRLYPRIMLVPPRHLVRVTSMIARLRHHRLAHARSHRSSTTTTLRSHVLILKILLPRMMKTSTVLCHHITSHMLAVGV
jgi:hypothetical protein